MTDGHMRVCKRLGHVRGYSGQAGSAHLICLDEGPISEGGPALCGWWPDLDRWFGRASQTELDKARDLPLCPTCAGAVKNPAVIPGTAT